MTPPIWTDMARACAKSDRDWLDHNESFETLSTYDLNAVWIYKPDGTLLFSRNNRYAKDLEELPVPPVRLVSHLSRERTCHFFYKVRQGWMEIRGATIHQSDDHERVTTPQGFFFAGRIWIDENIRRMVMFTGYSIRIVPADEVIPQQPSEEERGLITFSRMLPGWDGQPVAQLQVQHDSPIVREMNRVAERLFFWLIVAACVHLARPALSPSSAGCAGRCGSSRAAWKTRTRARWKSCSANRTSSARSPRSSCVRARREAELRDTEELLRHSQKLEAVGRLAGGVAHDFNNLLTAIIGYAELLELKLHGQPEYREQAVLIRQAGEQRGGPHAATARLQPQAAPAARGARSQCAHPRNGEAAPARHRRAHHASRIELADAEMRVLADATQLEQVILNLGVNARDAMPRGGTAPDHDRAQGRRRRPTRSTTTTRWRRASTSQLCVIDTGFGMDARDADAHFRAVLHDEGAGQRDGARARDRLRHREAERRRHQRRRASRARAPRSASICRG